MSILLGIIAINLFSIACSLNTEAKLTKQKLECLKYDAGNNDNLAKKLNLKDIPINQYCSFVMQN
tara:strand:- start:113 stop:307 length:195 start_codon:yes stop_codon:yes gene_type:complete